SPMRDQSGGVSPPAWAAAAGRWSTAAIPNRSWTAWLAQPTRRSMKPRAPAGTRWPHCTGRSLSASDDPHRVDDAREITEQRQQDIQPEGTAEPDLKKHPQRRQQNGSNESQDIHLNTPYLFDSA